MNRVKELCIRKGIEQKELSLLVGVSQPTVSDWFNQKKNPSGARLERLSEIFGVSRAYILGYDEDQDQSAITYSGTVKTDDNTAYNHPTLTNVEMQRMQRNLNGMNFETPLDAAPGEMSIEDRIYRLSPERRKQALEYLKFLEMQEDEE